MELNVLEARTDRRRHSYRLTFQPDAAYFENRTFDEAEISGEYERIPDSDDFLLTYRIRYVMRGACDSCGEPAALSGEIEGEERVCRGTGEISVPEDGKIDGIDDSYTYSGDVIDLGRIANEALALNVPSRLLCREDCRGLCPKCGKNLNEGDCACAEDHSDSPFAKLLNLKKN